MAVLDDDSVEHIRVVVGHLDVVDPLLHGQWGELLDLSQKVPVADPALPGVLDRVDPEAPVVLLVDGPSLDHGGIRRSLETHARDVSAGSRQIRDPEDESLAYGVHSVAVRQPGAVGVQVPLQEKCAMLVGKHPQG